MEKSHNFYNNMIEKTEKQQQEHIDMLCEIKYILDNLGIKNILTGSALLGMTRDDDLIKWCYGAVLIVFIKDVIKIQEKIIDEIKKKKYKIKKFNKSKTGWKIRADKGILNIEIAGYFKDGNYYKRISNNRERKIPIKFLENLKKIKIRNNIFLCPAETENYLTHLYDNWRVPVKSEKRNYRSKNFIRKL